MEIVVSIVIILLLVSFAIAVRLSSEVMDYPLFTSMQKVMYLSIMYLFPLFGIYMVSLKLGYRIFGITSDSSSGGAGLQDGNGDRGGGDGGC